MIRHTHELAKVYEGRVDLQVLNHVKGILDGTKAVRRNEHLGVGFESWVLAQLRGNLGSRGAPVAPLVMLEDGFDSLVKAGLRVFICLMDR